MAPSPHELNERFGLPEVRFEAGLNGHPCAVIENRRARARVYLRGALVSDYQPLGQEPVLWTSRHANLESSYFIHSGIPICWPWFGEAGGELPLHGFARLMDWDLKSVSQVADHATCLDLELKSSPETRRWWPHDFRLTYSVKVGPSLKVELAVFNLGRLPVLFSQALHTYLKVGDVAKASLEGLGETGFLDATRDMAEDWQTHANLRFTEETDRVYLDTRTECLVGDPGLGRKISLKKQGSASTVVWNPWTGKAGRMPDYGQDEWKGMLCVETGNVKANSICLKPGEAHSLRLKISTQKI
jgi:dihydroxy-acid dehydratase/glucose-6-phosphate 1-epimerase